MRQVSVRILNQAEGPLQGGGTLRCSESDAPVRETSFCPTAIPVRQARLWSRGLGALLARTSARRVGFWNMLSSNPFIDWQGAVTHPSRADKSRGEIAA